jgi:hypothetical protein
MASPRTRTIRGPNGGAFVRFGSISAAELRDLGDRCFSETGRSGSRPDTIADLDVV